MYPFKKPLEGGRLAESSENGFLDPPQLLYFTPKSTLQDYKCSLMVLGERPGSRKSLKVSGVPFFWVGSSCPPRGLGL